LDCGALCSQGPFVRSSTRDQVFSLTPRSSYWCWK